MGSACSSEELEAPVDKVQMLEKVEPEAEEVDAEKVKAEQEQKEKLAKQEQEEKERKATQEADAREERRRDEEKRAEEEKRAAVEKEQRLKEQREAETVEKQRQKEAEAETVRMAADDKAKKAEADKKSGDTKKLESYLKKESFPGDVNTPKKANRGKMIYPLHLAVKQKDCDMVEIMLNNNVNIRQKSGGLGHTPLDKAQKYNSNDSHRPIINILKAAEQKKNLGA